MANPTDGLNGYRKRYPGVVEFTRGIEITGGTPGTTPGGITYDNTRSAMEFVASIGDAVAQVPFENWTLVYNDSGIPIPDGTIVCITGYDATAEAHTVSLAKADSLDTAHLLGMVTTPMAIGAMGIVTTFGWVNGIDTSLLAPGAEVYLSDSVAGEWTTTKPAIAIQIGNVGDVAVDGNIFANIHYRQPSIYMSLQSLAVHNFTPGTPIVIPFSHEVKKKGMVHSNTVNPEIVEIVSSGSYTIAANFQVNRTIGANSEKFYAWLQLYPAGGSAWANIDGTLIEQTTFNAGDDLRLTADMNIPLDRGDRLRIMADATSANIILDYQAAGAVMPAKPSAYFRFSRTGDL